MNIFPENVIGSLISCDRGVDTSQANDYLMKFETSNEAWQVAHQLLQLSSSNNQINYRFFGAKIFYSKIQKDLSQLPSEQINALKDLLIQSILLLSQESSIDITTIRYLCLSLSALALQSNQNDIVHQILSWLNPFIATAPRVVLEFLTVLPEECYNRHITVEYSVRESFSQQLCDSSKEVFQFLEALIENASVAVRNQILRCFEHWIGTRSIHAFHQLFISYLGNTNISSSDLISTPLFKRSLEASSHLDLFEEAVEVIITTCHKYDCRDPLLCDTILDHILTLRPIWSAQVSSLTMSSGVDEMDTCRAYARLFADCAESFLDYLVSPQMNIQTQSSMFQQLVDCAKFPYANEIARIPLKFFYDVSIILHHSNDSQTTCQLLSPFFSNLIYVSIQQMLLPLDILQGLKAISEELRADRSDWRETIGDCREVVGTQTCLQMLCGLIQEQMNNSEVKWEVVEACLSGLLFVGPSLPSEESVYMPFLLQFILTLPEILALRITAMELLGRCSRWISHNPAYLPQTMLFLMASLPSQQLCTCAAESIMHLLQACAGLTSSVNLPIQELHDSMVKLREANALPLEADLSLLDGVCGAISSYDQTTCGNMLISIVQPIASSLTQQLSLDSCNHALIIANIDRLTAILRYTRVTYVSGEHPILTAFLLIQPLCQRTLEMVPSEHACEKVCRLYKYGMRSAGKAFAGYLDAICSHLLQAFQLKQYSPLIYAASICVTEFGNTNGQYEDILYNMLWGFSAAFFQKCQTLKDFENFPDVVEEYFHLLARFLELCPKQLVHSSQLPVLVSAGLTGLQLHHKDATKGILNFFERLISVSGNLSADSNTAQLAETAVLQLGDQLVSSLFRSLLGEMPAYVLHESSGSLVDVLWRLKQRQPTLLQVRYNNIYVIIIFMYL